jgi:hypothetical protein
VEQYPGAAVAAMSWLVGAVTQIVLLGTGTPAADPERSGPATAVVADDTPYLVDFGPGVVPRSCPALQSRQPKPLACHQPCTTGRTTVAQDLSLRESLRRWIESPETQLSWSEETMGSRQAPLPNTPAGMTDPKGLGIRCPH